MDVRKLRKSLEYADRLAIPFVMVLGEDELKSGRVKVKNMLVGSEVETAIEDLVDVLRK